MRLKAMLAVSTLWVCLSSAGLAQNLILNGDFETVQVVSPAEVPLNSWTKVFTTLPNEVRGSTYQEYVDNYGGSGTFATGGNNTAAFNYGDIRAGATLSQTFTAVAGQAHRLSFDYGNFGASLSQQLLVEVFLGGDTPVSILLTDATGDQNFSTLFNHFSQEFTTASSGVYTLRFTDQTSGTLVASDMLLDNVNLIVPELNAASAVFPFALLSMISACFWTRRRRPLGA